MNSVTSTQLRSFVIGIAICAANVTSAQIQYPDAPVDAPFQPQSARESLLPETKTLLPQTASGQATTSAAAEVNEFGPEGPLALSITGLLPGFSPMQARPATACRVARRAAFGIGALGTIAMSAGNPFGQVERFRSLISPLEPAGF